MRLLIRRAFRAALREDVDEASLSAALAAFRETCRGAIGAGEMNTASVFRYRQMLFVYLELTPERAENGAAEALLPVLAPFLKSWPAVDGPDRPFVPMTPVFWHDQPVYAREYTRAQPPEKRCGRIALLRPEKLMSYVTFHQALVREGLLVGDRRQFISLHENVLFSYFETPRDREQVNIRRSNEKSRVLEEWLAADPDSHFIRFPESPNENFHIIETVVSA